MYCYKEKLYNLPYFLFLKTQCNYTMQYKTNTFLKQIELFHKLHSFASSKINKVCVTIISKIIWLTIIF